MKVTAAENRIMLPIDSRNDYVAVIVTCLTLAVAILYPETFMNRVPIFGSQNYSPLSMMFPIMAVTVAYYLYINRNELKPGKLDMLVLVYAGYLLARNIIEPSNLVAMKYIVFGLGMYYLTATMTCRKEGLIRALVGTLVALMTLTSIYGLTEYAFQDNFIYHDYISEIVRDPTVGLHRIGSTVAHPVPFGAFILQALPFSILVWIRSSNRLWKAACMGATLLATLALFFTYSKGSWIVAVICSIAALLFYRGGKSRKVILPALMILVLVVFTTVVFWEQVRFETETRAEGSVDVRLVGWRAAIDGIAENPVVGVGLRQGEQEIKKYIDPEWYELAGRPLPVDNYYLSLILEAGFIGAAIWIAMLVMIIVEGYNVVKSRKMGWTWALAAMASIVSISMNAVTFEAMLIWSNFIVFWMTAGMIHGVSWRQVADENSTKIVGSDE